MKGHEMSDYNQIIELIEEIRNLQEEQDENRDKEEELKYELEGLEDDIKQLEKLIQDKRTQLEEQIDEATLAGEAIKSPRPYSF